jgi:hypothetical protein
MSGRDGGDDRGHVLQRAQSPQGPAEPLGRVRQDRGGTYNNIYIISYNIYITALWNSTEGTIVEAHASLSLSISLSLYLSISLSLSLSFPLPPPSLPPSLPLPLPFPLPTHTHTGSGVLLHPLSTFHPLSARLPPVSKQAHAHARGWWASTITSDLHITFLYH